MATDDAWPLQVFFDGACPLCSREVAVYRRRDREGHIQWVDISKPDFHAAAYGLDAARVQQVMHAKTAAGRVFTQFAAFVEIWRALPGWPAAVLRAIFAIPGMISLANIFYRIFAKNRYRLTGRCTPESCSIRR